MSFGPMGGRLKGTEEYREHERLAKLKRDRARGVRPLSIEVQRDNAKRLSAEAAIKKNTEISRSKGEKHQSALVWKLKSPDGRVYFCRNLSLFIRTNKQLFSEDELKPLGRGDITVIEGRLRKLSPRRKNPYETSGGWTWAMGVDYGLDDIVGRQVA